MKNLFLIIVLLVLSCKDKDASAENVAAETAIADVTAVMENNTNVTPSEGTIENHRIETISEENNATSENPDYNSSKLYKGTLNGTIKISLYLKEEEHPCGGNKTILNAMYKYDNQDKWILLSVTADKKKKNFCMVEDGFSGVLFLEENEGNFSGNWISTNTKKQFKVALENQLLDIKFAKDHTIVEELDEILFDELIYAKNDC